ncbi:hypothetical protein [Allokutzneria sp. NRRL B-24872]|uniref:hypothetical protein n=1 Tax=Allokutzneria sp. NRRL B-24872 TaxID=1137961 RepID=UPI0011775637|nr:hypothetical protein [Allokutzneria sp. NRRL B-24872]
MAVLALALGVGSGLASASVPRSLGLPRAADDKVLNDNVAKVLAFRQKADCVRNSALGLCSLVKGKTDAQAVSAVKQLFENSKTVATSLVADSDMADAIKDAKKAAKVGVAPPVDKVKKVTDPLVEKALKSKSFANTKAGKYLKNAQPSKAGTALWAATTVATFLDGSSSASDKAVAAVGIIPVVGQLASLIHTTIKDPSDVEGIVTGTIGLAAAVITIACPPLGTAITAALAVYSVGKALFQWLSSCDERDRYKVKLVPMTASQFNKVNLEKIGVQWETGGDKAVVFGAAEAGKKVLTFLFEPPADKSFYLNHDLGLTVPTGITLAGAHYVQKGGAKATSECAHTNPDEKDPAELPFWNCTTKGAKGFTVTQEKPVVVDLVFDAASADACTSGKKQCQHKSLRIDLQTYVNSGDSRPTRVSVDYEFV